MSSLFMYNKELYSNNNINREISITSFNSSLIKKEKKYKPSK